MGLVGGLAPNFKAEAVVNGGETVKDFSLEQFLGKKLCNSLFLPKGFYFCLPL